MAPGAFLATSERKPPAPRGRGRAVHWTAVTLRLLALLVVVLAAGTACSDEERPPLAPTTAGERPLGPSPATDRCARPNTGCACEEPGTIADCGEVRLRSGDYVTCSQGTRLCGDDRRWGECAGDHSVTRRVAPTRLRTQALGAQMPCSPADVCDPLCTSFTDNASGLTDIDPNLCVQTGGLSVCGGCGYIGPRGDGDVPSEWQDRERSCRSDDDCGFDRRCVDETCQGWSYPCHDTTGEQCGAVDLVAGPPCVSNGDVYHVQVCNRGFARADAGTLRVGLYSDPADLDACAGPASPAPDAGSIEFTLSAAPGAFIDPGRCIELNPSNSVASGLDLSEARGVFVNHDGAIAECNACNNWNALNPQTACIGCTNLECDQTCPETTLTGTVRDPAGVNPLPSVMVYVPNGELSQFSETVACDTCETLFSGSPIASATTGPDGSFTLQNVPANVSFPLVMQIGRWRRQVQVDPIAPCATAALPVDLGRLPRTQRRCVGATCTGEGDIPQMALLLGDADPLQCLFRKIGIADSEFTSSDGPGRVHLFNHNGMTLPGARTAFGGAEPLLSDAAALDRYNAIFAPCDFRHNQYPASRPRSGPSLNSHPQPTATAAQRANVAEYLARGGRLFATHWLSLDFVHLTYERPADPNPIFTPLDSPVLTSLPNWEYADPAVFNPDAPVIHQFGQNVERGGNTRETANEHGGGPGPPPPGFTYTIDQSHALGQLFSSWASVVNASPAGPGTVTFNSWAQLVRAVRAPAVRLAYGNSATSAPNRAQEPCIAPCPDAEYGGEHSVMFQFDTPWNVPAADQCGRVVVAQSHVAEHPTCQILGSEEACQNSTPTDCACLRLPEDDASAAERTAAWTAACGTDSEMTPQEKAFEFLVFSTMQCVGSIVPPPPPVRLPPTQFTREYVAECASGETPIWRHFSWRAAIPQGTSIEFYAATGDSDEDFVDPDNPVVLIGTAEATSSTWTSHPDTVDQLLREHGVTSRNILRIQALFHPSGTLSPSLSDWRMVFDCVPNE